MTWYLVITSQFLTRLLITVITFLLKTQVNKSLGDDLVRGFIWLYSGPNSGCRSSLFSVHCVLEYLALNTIQRRMHFAVCYCLYTALYSYLGFSLTYITFLTSEDSWISHLRVWEPASAHRETETFSPFCMCPLLYQLSIDDSLQKSFGIFIFL